MYSVGCSNVTLVERLTRPFRDRHGDASTLNVMPSTRQRGGSPMKIYTRTGDRGRHRPVRRRPGAEGPPAGIGLWRCRRAEFRARRGAGYPADDFSTTLLESIQRDLFSIGGHLATPDPGRVAKALEKADLSEQRVSEFEQVMDEADAELPPLRAFVLPAGTPKAAALHLARTVCRRAERSVVSPGPGRRVPQALSDLSQPPLRSAVHPRTSGQPSGTAWGRHLVSPTVTG